MKPLNIIALLEDWDIGTRLARLSTSYSYKLRFVDKISELSNYKIETLVIIDIDIINNKLLKKFVECNNDQVLFILGYIRNLAGIQISEFKEIGYDMVLKRDELLKNLDTIIRQIASVN